jgi:hypothetical protein
LKIPTIPAYKAQTLTMNKMNRMLNKIIYMKILTIPANKAQTPTINRMLKTADPTIVPTPTSLFAINTPIKKHTTQEEFEDTKGVATAQRKKNIISYNSQLPQNRRIIPGALEGVLLSNNMLAAVYTTCSGRVAAILL